MRNSPHPTQKKQTQAASRLTVLGMGRGCDLCHYKTVVFVPKSIIVNIRVGLEGLAKNDVITYFKNQQKVRNLYITF